MEGGEGPSGVRFGTLEAYALRASHLRERRHQVGDDVHGIVFFSSCSAQRHHRRFVRTVLENSMHTIVIRIQRDGTPRGIVDRSRSRRHQSTLPPTSITPRGGYSFQRSITRHLSRDRCNNNVVCAYRSPSRSPPPGGVLHSSCSKPILAARRENHERSIMRITSSSQTQRGDETAWFR